MIFYYPNKPIQVYDPDKILSHFEDVSQWVSQPKLNGKRVEIYCKQNKVTLFSRENRYWPVDSLNWAWLRDVPLSQPWFLDGELLRDDRIVIWDFAVLAGQEVYKRPYNERLEALQIVLRRPLSRGRQTLALVETKPATAYREFLKLSSDPYMEGIVWKQLHATNFWGPNKTSKVATQFKYRY